MARSVESELAFHRQRVAELERLQTGDVPPPIEFPTPEGTPEWVNCVASVGTRAWRVEAYLMDRNDWPVKVCAVVEHPSPETFKDAVEEIKAIIARDFPDHRIADYGEYFFAMADKERMDAGRLEQTADLVAVQAQPRWRVRHVERLARRRVAGGRLPSDKGKIPETE